MSEQLGRFSGAAFLRVDDLIGRPEVTEAQAEANRAAGRRNRRPTPGKTGLLPISRVTLHRMVSDGRFPRPVRLVGDIPAWRVEDVTAWMESRQAKGSRK